MQSNLQTINLFNKPEPTMLKNIFLLLVFCYSIGNAQTSSENSSIIPAPNSYKANGDSISLTGQIKISFENNKFSTKEKKTATIFESAINANTPNKKSNIEVLFIAKKPASIEKKRSL
jgi:hexosaminidase